MTHSTNSDCTARTKTAVQDETDITARVLTGSALFTATAGIILVDAELIAVAGTAGYALSSYLGAGPIGLGLIATVIGLPTAWLCWRVAKQIVAGERDIQG